MCSWQCVALDTNAYYRSQFRIRSNERAIFTLIVWTAQVQSHPCGREVVSGQPQATAGGRAGCHENSRHTTETLTLRRRIAPPRPRAAARRARPVVRDGRAGRRREAPEAHRRAHFVALLVSLLSPPPLPLLLLLLLRNDFFCQFLRFPLEGLLFGLFARALVVGATVVIVRVVGRRGRRLWNAARGAGCGRRRL